MALKVASILTSKKLFGGVYWAVFHPPKAPQKLRVKVPVPTYFCTD